MSEETKPAADAAGKAAATTRQPSASTLGIVEAWRNGAGAKPPVPASEPEPGPEPQADLASTPLAGAAPAAPPAGKPAEPPKEAPAPQDGTVAAKIADATAKAAQMGRETTKARLMAAGMPEGLARALASHAKNSEVEAWLSSRSAVVSQSDSAYQPGAPTAPTPSPAGKPASAPESDLLGQLAGFQKSLEESGILEQREAESFAGFWQRIVERQNQLEQALMEGQHEMRARNYEREIVAAKEGLAGQFPQVLDSAAYNDQVLPIFEALATSPATGSRSLQENLAAACRAAWGGGDVRTASRNATRDASARTAPAAPTAHASSTQTISKVDYGARIIAMRRNGESDERIDEFRKKWSGRVV